MTDTNEIAARVYAMGVYLAQRNGHTVPLPLSGAAYTSKGFERVYEEVAKRLGHRPAFTIVKPVGEGMEVFTTVEDEAVAREMIAAMEAEVR